MAPVFARSHEIRAYHLELLQQVQDFHGYYDSRTDLVLFEEFSPLYEAVASRLNPTFDPGELQSIDRHRFFICEGIVNHPLTPEQQVPDLSGLEKLMGYQLPTEPPSDQLYLTSGDDDADLVAALQMCFKESAIALTRQYSRADLINILAQTQNLTRGEEALKELQQKRDRELFEKNRETIEAQLAQAGGVFF